MADVKETKAEAQKAISEATGMSEGELNAIASGLQSAGKLLTAKDDNQVMASVREIIKPGVEWACHAGAALLLSFAPASVGSSALLAGALEAACIFGATKKIEDIVLNNYRVFFSDTIPESVSRYYKAIYGVDVEAPVLAAILDAASRWNALPSIFNVTRETRFNPSVVKAAAEAAAKKAAAERARLARLAEEKRQRIIAAKKERSRKLAEFIADLKAEKLEPMRRYLVSGGAYLRDDLAMFDKIIQQRGFKLKADGNITWPALTAGALAVGAFIVWRAKGLRRG